jgi:ABC-type branched-subunit amino acid transport system permease subunit
LYTPSLDAPQSIRAPFPAYSNEIAVLWLMVVFAMTWDILGGQMGYNSLGNIVFFGAGMYICAVVQIGLFYDVGASGTDLSNVCWPLVSFVQQCLEKAPAGFTSIDRNPAR